MSFFLQLDLISIVLLKVALEGLICHYTPGRAPSLGFFGKKKKKKRKRMRRRKKGKEEEEEGEGEGGEEREGGETVPVLLLIIHGF